MLPRLAVRPRRAPARGRRRRRAARRRRSPTTRASPSCSPPRATPRRRAPATSSTGSTSPPAVDAVTVFHAGTTRDDSGALRDRTAAVCSTSPRPAPTDRDRRAREAAAYEALRGARSQLARGVARTAGRHRRGRRDAAPSAERASVSAPGDGVRTPAMTSEQGMHRSGPPSLRRRDQAHGAPGLAALLAGRDGVLGPVLRAVRHPRSTSSPVWDPPRSLPRAVPDRDPSAPLLARRVFGRRKGPLDRPLRTA